MNWKILKTAGFLLVIALFFSACNNPHPGFKKTKSGIYYEVLGQVDSLKGMKADSSQFYIMDMNYGTADSLIFKSEMLPDKEVRIPKREKGYDGDIWEALSLFSKGDSVHFILRADSFFLKTTRAPQVPEMFKKDNEVHFFINIKDLKTQAQLDAEKAAFANARRVAEQLEIAKFIADNNWTVKPLEDGMYFNKIKSGKGRKVRKDDFLTFDFELRKVDGTLIYSSVQANRPGQFQYGKRFDTQGFMEAMGMMRQGDEVELLVPSSLAYGENGRGGILDPYTPLHYFVRLTAVKTPAEHEAEVAAQKKAEEAQKEALRVKEESTIAKYIADNEITVEPTADGLYFISTQEGTGEMPKAGDKVRVHYTGTLLDGTKFDSSHDRDQPFEFVLGKGQVIKGWDEGIAMLKVGGKATLIMPSKLAYGERQAGAVIKPYSPLKFDVELLEIVKE